MSTYKDKTQKGKGPSMLNKEHGSVGAAMQFVDKRPEAIAQRKLQEMVNNSEQASALNAFQLMANNSAQVKEAIQLQAMANNFVARQQAERNENHTGLPDSLKAGVENLSGYAMDDVKVHYNSEKPAQLQAHAYAQGTDIHLGAGQEKHLPHEAWHVVQQKQGRVKPTIQMKGNVNVNDDAGLEKEADVMGGKALQLGQKSNIQLKTDSKGKSNGQPIQRFPQLAEVQKEKGENDKNAGVHKSNLKKVKGNNRKVKVKSGGKEGRRLETRLANQTKVRVDFDKLDKTGRYVWVEYDSGEGKEIGYIDINHIAIVNPELYFNEAVKDKDDPTLELIPAYEDQMDTPLFPDAPAVEHVKQGFLGDCYFVSAVASIVKKNPNYIMDMMEDMDSYVVVKFYKDGQRSSVNVDKKIAKFSNGESQTLGKDPYARGSIWMSLLEKAYATFKNTSYSGIEGGEATNVWAEFLNVDGAEEEINMKQAYVEVKKKSALDDAFQKGTLTEKDIPYPKSPWPYVADPGKGWFDNSAFVNKIKELKHSLYKQIFPEHDEEWAAFVENPENHYKLLAFKNAGEFEDLFKEKVLSEELRSMAIDYLLDNGLTTGYSGSGWYTDKQRSIFNTIVEKIEAGELMAAGTPKIFDDGTQAKDQIHSKHSYSIFDYRRDENGLLYVKMRNPWGQGGIKYNEQEDNSRLVAERDDTNGGEFEIELTHFTSTFNKLYYSMGVGEL